MDAANTLASTVPATTKDDTNSGPGKQEAGATVANVDQPGGGAFAAMLNQQLLLRTPQNQSRPFHQHRKAESQVLLDASKMKKFPMKVRLLKKRNVVVLVDSITDQFYRRISRYSNNIFSPQQLMIVLSTKEYEHIIAWTPEGDKFTIHNSKALISQIFPKYFKQCKYPSFLRKVSLMSTGEIESLIFNTLRYIPSIFLPAFFIALPMGIC